MSICDLKAGSGDVGERANVVENVGVAVTCVTPLSGVNVVVNRENFICDERGERWEIVYGRGDGFDVVFLQAFTPVPVVLTMTGTIQRSG